MKYSLYLCLAAVPWIILPGRGGPAEAARAEAKPLPSAEEATERARLLHAAFDGTLRVMHRDFFHKGDKAIPSVSLKDVFKTFAEEQHITVRWLATAETIMSEDNKAVDEFQKAALKAVTGGEKEYSAVENGRLRFAGAIALENQCLKCHVPQRKTLEERFAALEISMPVKAAAAGPKP